MGSAFSFSPRRVNVEPVGTKDGTNATFTLPSAEKMFPGSLEVYLNGVLYQPNSIVKSGDNKSFTITGDILPTADDSFTCTYTKNPF